MSFSWIYFCNLDSILFLYSSTILYDIFSLITPKLDEMLGCKGVLTKAPIYAVERIKAIQKVGFTKSEHILIGKTGYAYDGYWTIK